MGKLIDEQTAYDVLTDYYHHSTDTQHAALKEALEMVPTVDAVPVRHGRWTMVEGELAFWDMCSACGRKIVHRTPYYDFCPHCGARMDGKDGDNHG